LSPVRRGPGFHRTNEGGYCVMLTGIPKVKVGALVAVLAGALCVAGVGPATASAKLVKSDSVSFKGTVNSTGEWLTTKCKLTSDGEFVPGTTKLQVFPCELQGQALGIGGSVIEVGSLWKSSDGIAGFPFQAVPRTKSEPPLVVHNHIPKRGIEKTVVTKHDERGRIIEFERREA